MEQRRAQRYRLRLPILITHVGAAPLARTGQTLDISSAGVLFESPSDIEPGERVEFVITLLSATPQVKLRCLGKVLRSAPQPQNASCFDIAVTIDRYHFVRAARLEAVAANA